MYRSKSLAQVLVSGGSWVESSIQFQSDLLRSSRARLTACACRTWS